MTFTFKIKRTSDSVTPQIERIKTALGTSGRRKVLMSVADRFREMARSTFGVNKTTYRGNTWAKYSPAYAKKVGTSSPSLFRSGKLKASIRVTPPRGNSVGVFADVKYAAAQFLGSKRGLPARRYFPMEGHGTMWRLTARADKDLTIQALSDFYKLSGGALPKTMGILTRSTYSAGNPLTGFV